MTDPAKMSDKDLDAAVAEKVLGWKWHRCHERNASGETVYHFAEPGYQPPEWWKRPTESGTPPPQMPGKVYHVHMGHVYPSTSIEAAWSVEEKACDTESGKRRYVRAMLMSDDSQPSLTTNAVYALIHATPRQRCLAALAAVREEQ